MIDQMQQKDTPSFNRFILRGMALGGCFALFLMTVFLVAAGPGKPEWGEYWRLRPLILTPVVASFGGAFFGYLTFRFRNGWLGIAAVLFGLVIYVVSLWLGSVLGLDGTHWD
jgi:ABC-type branched-subunit amino acid transport system permease subunit